MYESNQSRSISTARGHVGRPLSAPLLLSSFSVKLIQSVLLRISENPLFNRKMQFDSKRSKMRASKLPTWWIFITSTTCMLLLPYCYCVLMSFSITLKEYYSSKLFTDIAPFVLHIKITYSVAELFLTFSCSVNSADVKRDEQFFLIKMN